MIAFTFMLERPAREAGMAVPDDTDDFDHEVYPHFHVFCVMQIGRPMPSPDSAWENAKVIAAIPADMIRTVTMDDLYRKGFV